MPVECDKTARFVRDLTENARQLYSYILAMVQNWADTDDVFQETSALLWTKYDEYQPGTNFLGWARRIACNKVLQFRREAGRNVLRFSQAVNDAVDRDSAAEGDLWNQRERLLAECYQRLSALDRQLIDLRYDAGATTKGVAKATGRSVDAVYKALNRIHRQLLECIESGLEERP
jgi:RNA polymerase sigma-70 factor (ECF subfamily)